MQWDKAHMSYNFDLRKGPIHTEWFKGGTTNVCYNCLDRNLELGRGDEPCFIWEGNEPSAPLPLLSPHHLWPRCRLDGRMSTVDAAGGGCMPMTPVPGPAVPSLRQVEPPMCAGAACTAPRR